MSESLRTNGHPVLRIERRLKHPPERVWRAITEPAQFSQWYPFPASAVEPRVGGRIRFDLGPAGTLEAVVTEAEAPRVFAFRVPAGEIVPGGREGDNLVHIELHPEADDGCLVVFTHTFVDLPAAASYASGGRPAWTPWSWWRTAGRWRWRTSRPSCTSGTSRSSAWTAARSRRRQTVGGCGSSGS